MIPILNALQDKQHTFPLNHKACPETRNVSQKVYRLQAKSDFGDTHMSYIKLTDKHISKVDHFNLQSALKLLSVDLLEVER